MAQVLDDLATWANLWQDPITIREQWETVALRLAEAESGGPYDSSP